MRRPAPLALILSSLLLGGFLFGGPSGSPSAGASGSQPATVAPSISAPPPTTTAVPTPGPDAVPTFTAGTTVATAAAGLRVRSGPGTSQAVVTMLPTGSDLVVVLGPVRADSYGWYLVPRTFDLAFNPIVAGFAHEGNAEFGPVQIIDANYAVRWVAAVLPGGGGCSFSADLVPGSGTAVPTVRATLGTAPAPGNLYGDFFAAHPELVGDIFLRVTSDCSWALTFLRSEPVGG